MIGFIDEKLVIVIDVVEGYEFLGGLQKALSRTITVFQNGKEISPEYIMYLTNLLESLSVSDKQAKIIAENQGNDLLEVLLRGG